RGSLALGAELRSNTPLVAIHGVSGAPACCAPGCAAGTAAEGPYQRADCACRGTGGRRCGVSHAPRPGLPLDRVWSGVWIVSDLLDHLSRNFSVPAYDPLRTLRPPTGMSGERDGGQPSATAVDCVRLRRVLRGSGGVRNSGCGVRNDPDRTRL